MFFFFSRTPQTLSRLWREFLRHNLKIQAKRTHENYERSITRLGEVLGHEPKLADLTDENIATLVRWLLDEGKKAPTANNYAKCLLALWRFANARGYVRTRPSIAKLSEPEPETSTWNKQELAALWRTAAAQPGYIGPVASRDWWLTLHMIAWDTAERTSAILAIEETWIDREQHTLHIPAEFRKGRTKRGSYRLRPATMAQIDQIWHPERKRLFEGLELRNFHRAYNALLACAGLPSGRRNGLQKIRRTVATALERAGGDATKFLQHSDRRTTELSYLDAAQLDDRGPVELLGPVEW